MIVCAKSHVGLIRDHNEDSFFVSEGGDLLIVADGMGGHKAGEVASKLAIDTIVKTREENSATGPLAEPAAWVEKANRVVFQKALSDIALNGMGTTVTLGHIVGNKLTIAHVGDSRAYLFSAGELFQKTRDHTYVEEMVRHNIMSRQAAKNHPRRNIITRAVGAENTVEVDTIEAELSDGDIILLCSDGLTGHVPDEVILSILKSDRTFEAQANELIECALDGGGSDNITIVLAQWKAGEAS